MSYRILAHTYWLVGMKCSGIYCDMGCDGEEKEYSVGVEVEDSVGVGEEVY